MSVLKKTEAKLGDLFKGLPQLSNNSKESLAAAWPWIALIFGILQLAAAYWLWRLTRVVEVLSDLVDYQGRYYSAGELGLGSFDKSMIYLGVIVLLVDAVILLMAFPKLQKRERRGWDLLFLGALLNVAYAALAIFIDGRGFGSFLINLLGSAVAFYLLFQVRDKYKTV